MTSRALNRALLGRQMLLSREDVSPVEGIERLIAMQAQQPRPPFIGLWSRIKDFERQSLLRLIRERQVVRSTMLRGTLHLMTTDDYIAFRPAIQQALTSGMDSILRGRGAKLDVGAVTSLAERRFEERPQTFSNLRAALLNEFPGLDERAMGYAARTSLPLVIVPEDGDWGYGSDPVFANAGSWLGRTIEQENRTGDLVLRYLAAFGPATVADMQAWSGLGKLKPVFETLRPTLRVFQEGRRELFDLEDGVLPPHDTPAPVRFLPGFDNAILAHADRSRIIADEHRARVTTKNLQVRPTFLVDGFVAGTWECAFGKKTATLTMNPFGSVRGKVKKELEEEAVKLARFIAPEANSVEADFRESAV